MEVLDFVESADCEKGFGEHYNGRIKPVLGELEENRLVQQAEYNKRKKLGVVVTVGIVVLAFVIAGVLSSQSIDSGNVFAFAVFLIIGLWAGWVRGPLRKYKSDVKARFLPVICEFFGDLGYVEKGEVDQRKIRDLNIFPMFNRVSAEDFISGSYKNVSIRLNEMRLKMKKKGKKGSKQVFSGLMIVIGFPKAFTGRTVVKRDAGKVGNWFSKSGSKDLNRVELEDPDFESIFEVYSSDQVEARFLLTTAFMERLLNLAKARSGGEAKPSVQCEFVGDELVIAVPSRQNLFEPGSIDKSALDHDDIHAFLGQMDGLFKLIDVLKLDRV